MVVLNFFIMQHPNRLPNISVNLSVLLKGMSVIDYIIHMPYRILKMTDIILSVVNICVS